MLRNGTHVPKSASQLRNTLRNGALELRSRFAASKWGLLCCEMALVRQTWFRSCEIPCEMELWLRNWEFSCFGASQPFRSCEMGAPVLRSGTRVPNLVSQLRNTLRNGALTAKWGLLCCEMALVCQTWFRSCKNFRRRVN